MAEERSECHLFLIWVFCPVFFHVFIEYIVALEVEGIHDVVHVMLQVVALVDFERVSSLGAGGEWVFSQFDVDGASHWSKVSVGELMTFE